MNLKNFEKLLPNGLTPEQAKELYDIAKGLSTYSSKLTEESQKVNDFFLGKEMPNSLDMEILTIGIMILNANKVNQVLRLLTPEHFYHEKWKEAFEVIVKMYNEGRKIDLVTVSEYIMAKKIEKVKPYDIVEATNRVSMDTHLDDYMGVIYEKYASRRVIDLAYSMPPDIINGRPAHEVIDSAIMELRKLIALDDGEVKAPTDYIPEAIERFKKQLERGSDEIAGCPLFGIQNIDYELNGVEDGDLFVVGARPKMGKTAVFSNWATMAIQQNMPLLLMSGEIPNDDMVKRLLSIFSGTSLDDLRRNRYALDDPNISKALSDIFASKVYLSDKPLTMKSIRDRISEYYDKGVRRFGIDRFELISEVADARDENKARNQVSSQLRRMVNEYKDIGIVLVAQMSSAHEKTSTKKPSAVDIYGATALQANCTKMIGLWRPDQYNVTADKDGRDLKGLVEIMLLSGNNIPNGISVWAKFDKHTASFKEVEQEFIF